MFKNNGTVWSPRFKAIQTEFESAERKAPKMILELEGLSYLHRLMAVKLQTLSFHHRRVEMIQVP